MVSVKFYSFKFVVAVVSIVVLLQQCVEIYGEEVMETTTMSPSPSMSVSDSGTVMTAAAAENVDETIECINNIGSGVSVCTVSTIQSISDTSTMYPNGTTTNDDDVVVYQYKIYPSISSSIDTDVLFTISLERSMNTMNTMATTTTSDELSSQSQSQSQYVCDFIAINNIICNSCIYCTDDSYTIDCTNVPYGRKSNTCETGAMTLLFPLTSTVFTVADITTVFQQETIVVPTIAPTSPAPSSSTTSSLVPTTIVPTTIAPSSIDTIMPTSLFVEEGNTDDGTNTSTLSPSPSSSTITTLNPVPQENELIPTTLRPIPPLLPLDSSGTVTDGSIISGGGGGSTTVRTRQPVVSPIMLPPVTSQPMTMPPVLETTTGIIIKPCKTFTMDLYTSDDGTMESSTICVNPSRSSTSVGGIYMNNDIVPSTPEIQTYYYNSTIYYYNDVKLLTPISILMERTNEVAITTGPTSSSTVLDGICNYISINGRRCTGCTYCGNEQFTADCSNIVPYGLITDSCQSSIPVVFPFVTSIFLPSNTLGNI